MQAIRVQKSGVATGSRDLSVFFAAFSKWRLRAIDTFVFLTNILSIFLLLILGFRLVFLPALPNASACFFKVMA
jgi:hypothetical protein